MPPAGQKNKPPVRRLARLLAAGATLARAADALGISVWKTFTLARLHKLAHRRRALPPRVRRKAERLIASGTMSQGQVARAVRVAKSTICDWARADRRGRKARHLAVEFHQLRSPKRCPQCGKLVKLWPCLGCAAQKISPQRHREHGEDC